jgi:hypothetical protein
MQNYGIILKLISGFRRDVNVFWGITRRRVIIVYRRFGTTYRSHPHGSRVRVGKKAYNVDSGKYGGVAKRVI